MLLPVERVLGGEPKYTASEVAERSGLPVEFLMKQRHALGLSRLDPGERAWGEEDVEAAAHLRGFLEGGLSEDGVVEIARVAGESLARVSDASRQVIGRTFVREGDTERDLAQRLADAARALLPPMGHELEYIYRVHLREQLRGAVLSQEQVAAGQIPGSQEVVVCFADLVDFTKLGEAVPPEELGEVAGLLTEMASNVAETPVRLVKTIGDAAMLVAPEPEPVVAAALRLVEAADEAGDEFPSIRSGVASGHALERAGDWYGWPVNVASRVTGIARPSSVVTTAEVHDTAGDAFAWSSIGRRKLKGVRSPVPLFRARFPAEEP